MRLLSAIDADVRRRTATPRVSVVIPALNEALNLAAVLPRLPAVHEVILVDGGSVDGTVMAARRALPGIVTVLQGRRGKGNALAAGFARVTGDVVVMFDADGSADPAEIPAFVQALVDGADFAKGSRYVEGGGSADLTRLRSAGNWCLSRLFNRAFGTRYSDLCYGYNALWTDQLPLLDLPDPRTPPADSAQMYWGDGFEIETIINCRLATADATVVEVPSVERMRLFGESNLHAVSDGLRVLRTLVAEWWRSRASRRLARRLDRQLAETVAALETDLAA